MNERNGAGDGVWSGWVEVMTRAQDSDSDSKRGQLEKYRRLEESALQWLDRHERKLARGKPGEYGRKKVSDIMAGLTLNKTIKQTRVLRDWLARGISLGRERYGWEVALPPEIYLLPREKPLATEAEMIDQIKLSKLIEVFLRSLGDIAILGRVEREGQLMVSAIVSGGLLRKKDQDAFARTNRMNWRVTREMAWAELPTDGIAEDVSDDVNEIRLYYPDLITERLIMLHLMDHNGDGPLCGTNIWTCIRKYFRRYGVSKTDLPSSLGILSRWAEVRLRLCVPRICVEVLSGRAQTTSLRPQAWTRVRVDRPVLYSNNAGRPENEFIRRVGESGLIEGGDIRPLRSQFDYVGGIIRPLNHLKGKPARCTMEAAIRRYLEEYEDPVSDIEAHIANWTIYMVGSLRGRKGRPAPRTIVRYLQAIKTPLLEALCDCDTRSLGSEGWARKLQEAIDNAKDKSMPRILRYFIRYMRVTGSMPEVNIKGLEGMEVLGANVSANVVSPAHFEKALEVFKYPEPSRIDRMRRLAGMLGFYCGLRNNEIIHLRLCDVSDDRCGWLYVRDTKLNSVKRDASIRQIPVSAIAPKNWQRELREWVELRRDEEGGRIDGERLIFSEPGTASTPLRDEMLINPIQNSLRRVTRDESIVFYNLRHSFANWMFIRLLIPDYPEIRGHRMRALKQSLFEYGNCMELRRRLGLDPSNPSPDLLDIVSRLMGHANYETTLRSYLHLMGWIAGCILSGDELSLSEREMRGLFRDSSDYYRVRKKITRRTGYVDMYFLVPPLRSIWSKRGQREWGDPNEELISRSESPARTRTEGGREGLTIEMVPVVFEYLFIGNMSVARTAEALNLHEDAVDRVREQGEFLGKMKTKSGRTRIDVKGLGLRESEDIDEWNQLAKYVTKNGFAREDVAWLREKLQTMDPSHGGAIRLCNSTDVERMATIYIAIGVDRERIWLRVEPYQDADDEEIEAARTHWASVAGVDVDHTRLRAVKSRRKRRDPNAPKGWVDVRVNRPENSANICLDAPQSSPAVRRMLVMIVCSGLYE